MDINFLAELARLRNAIPMPSEDIAAVKLERVEEKKKMEKVPAKAVEKSLPSGPFGTSATGAIAPSTLPPRSITSDFQQLKMCAPAAASDAVSKKTSLPVEGKKRKTEESKKGMKKKGKIEEKMGHAGEKKASSTPSNVVTFSGKNLPPKQLPPSKAPLGDALVAGSRDKASSSKTPRKVPSPDCFHVVERHVEESGERLHAVNSALRQENDSLRHGKARTASERNSAVDRRLSRMEALIGILMSDVALLKAGYPYTG